MAANSVLFGSDIIANTITVSGLTNTGSLQLSAGAYQNWGSTIGASGYGFRDNAGTIEFKDNAGAWASVAAAASGGGWTRTGTTVALTTGTDLVSIGSGAAIGSNNLSVTGTMALTGTLTMGTSQAINATTSLLQKIGGVTNLTLTSGAAQFAGTLGVTGASTFTGGATFNAVPQINSVGSTARLNIGNQAGTGFPAAVYLINDSTLTNWVVGTSFGVNGRLEFIPSTAGGGTSFTTPILGIVASGQLQGVVGSASVPTYSFAGQTGYGMYYGSGLAFAANGTLALTINSSQLITTAAGLTVGTVLTVPGTTTPVLTTAAAITTGAGASAGTLLNAPASGNPTKWIPINDNGTTRYIPAW